MLIEVDVSRYFDWEKAPEGEKGTRASADGTLLRRVVVEQASTTFINISEAEIRDQVLATWRLENWSRPGPGEPTWEERLDEMPSYEDLLAEDPALRPRSVARYVEETVMPWHAPRAAVVAARVITADEDEVSKALAQRLGVPTSSSKPRSKRK